MASTQAKLGFPELGLGIIPAFGGTQRLVRTVGQTKAAELILFHSIIDGEEASRIGLVNRAVEPDQLMKTSREMAGTLSGLSPLAVRLELLFEAQNKGFGTGMALEFSLGALAVTPSEAERLLGGFLQKRK